jgi:hypothetical protein
MDQKSSDAPSRAGVLAPLLLFVCLALAVLLALSQQRPPKAVPASAPATEFSSGRALKHLEAIARAPHPLGSQEHAVARDYLMGQLTEMGLSPEVQETIGVNSSWGIPYRAGVVQNILVRLKGTGGGKALLLAAHYDSVPTGPGASDDAAGVATLLETLRALKTGAPLKNDIIFLFTDGEESGLLGANAFNSEHAWSRNVGLVLNFEARGNHGPSIMFETSDGNGWLIQQFAQAAPAPVATSLAYEIYSRLPKDTDLSVFKSAGVPGFNFAYINGLTHYHTMLDNAGNIDERSLQHHGSYALALARHFGNLDLENRQTGNAVYFDLFGSTLIHYSQAWVIPCAILVTILFIALIMTGIKRGRLSLKGITLAFFAFLLSMLAAALVVTILWWLIGRLHSGYKQMLHGITYNGGLYTFGFIFLTLALALLLFNLFRKRISVENLSAGALLCWLLAMIATSLLMPGASYLFTWPLLFSLLGLGYSLFYGERQSGAKWLPVVLALTAIPAIVLVVPAIYHISAALSLSLSGAIMLLTMMLIGLLVPHLFMMMLMKRKRWLLPSASLLAALLLLLAGTLTSNFDKQHPGPDNVFYGLDADTGKATWASLDAKADQWTSQFFSGPVERGPVTEFLPLFTIDFMKSQAPLMPLPAPEATLLDENKQGDKRVLHLRITSQRQAPLISFYSDPNVTVTGASVDGKPIGDYSAPLDAGDSWGVLYFAPPPSGIELTVEVKSEQPFKMRVIDFSYGLPQGQAISLQSRPDNTTKSFLPFSESTLVSKSFTF